MESYELLRPDHSPSGVWACGACRAVTTAGDRAERCCLCRECGSPLGTEGVGLGRSHDACLRRRREAADAKRLAEAELVPGWPGWVVYAGDRYFPTVEDLVEHLECRGVPVADWPERVHACVEVPFAGLDAEDLVEDVTDGAYEGMADDLHGVAELTAAVEAFNAANKHLVSYEPDYTRAVPVPRPESEG